MRADLTDERQVASALEAANPEVIVNLVGLTDVDECERDPRRAYMANVRTTENVVTWIHKYRGSCHLVQLSTDQVYDGPGPHRENDVTLSNYYAFSKYASELLADNVSATVLRTNFFGRSQYTERRSLSDWIVDSLRHQRQITVFEDICFSPLTLQRLTEMIELVIVKRRRGVFNVGSHGGMSKADFAFALAKVLRLPTASMTRGTSDHVKLVAYRPKDMRMNPARFEETFGLELPALADEIESVKSEYV